MPKKYMKEAIWKHIKALLKNKGVSQEAVADYLNISQSAYSRIENGDSHSWACYVEKICIYFEVELEYLVAIKITPKTVVSEPNVKSVGN
jgi:transcriptional regulator with XRE-family HTH domain